MTDPLTILRTSEFDESLGFILPPATLRLAMQRSPHVARIATAIRRGEITEHRVRAFVNSLASEYQQEKALPGDLAFTALAVALEQIPVDYAEEFLCDLARLHLAEMTTSIRVARECLKNRYLLPKNEVRTSMYPSAKTPPTRTFVEATSRVEPRTRVQTPVRYRDFAGAC